MSLKLDIGKNLKALADIMGMTIFIRIAETISNQESNEFKLVRETDIGSSEQRPKAPADHSTLALRVVWDQPRCFIFHWIVQRLKTQWQNCVCQAKSKAHSFSPGAGRDVLRGDHSNTLPYGTSHRKSPNKISFSLVNTNWFGGKPWRTLLQKMLCT